MIAPTKLALQLSKPVSGSPSDANNNTTAISCHEVPENKANTRSKSKSSNDPNHVLVITGLKVKKPFLLRHSLSGKSHCDLQMVLTNVKQGSLELERVSKLQRQDQRKKTLLAKRLVGCSGCTFRNLNSHYVGARDQALALLQTPNDQMALVRSNQQYDFIRLFKLFEYYHTYCKHISSVSEAIEKSQTFTAPVTQCVLVGTKIVVRVP